MPKSSKFAALALVLWVGVAFLIPKLLGLKGPNLWILFGGLSIIGLLAAGAYIWLEMRNAAAESASDRARGGDSGDELSQSFREAENKLRSSNLGKNARFGNLSVVFVVGPQGSTKTTSMIHSGLNPELLAGQIYQDNSGNAVAPTRFANIWFARQSIFLEPASTVMEDAGKWSRLIRRLRPGQLASAVRKGVQAPRAAVVLFDCEEFLKPRAAEAVAAAARNLHDKLGEISKTMGISLPVYVMFTKGDRLPFFHDYFHTLTNEEAAQVLGATLPVAGSGRSAYDQEETARLNTAFDNLYFSLAQRRTDFLAREGDAGRLPGIYEFPREFQKVRTLLANFMLDLCRPSQLSAAPFLRGFYFSGVRPVLVRDAAPAPVVADAKTFKPEGGATGVFRVAEEGARASAADVSPARRVPQWVFLKNFFGHVLLADDAALAASAVSVKTNLLRRVLLGSFTAILLLLSVAFIVSFSRNWGLVSGSREAATAIGSRDVSAAVPSIPSLDDLTRLDALRQSVETIGRYNRDGAPLSYRWGLYIGNELYPKLRRVYFARFWQLLFVSTQLGLINNLQTLPASPAPTDSYQYPYDSLKAYLITTSNHDKSTLAYLSPLLLTRWEAGKSVDSARAQLARKQFDFYSEELKYENPFPSENDSAAVARARRYLAQFAGTERVYRFMQAEVNKNAPSVNFNQKFPGSAQTVVNNREMAGAFTKAGWPLMLDAIKHAERYFNGEQWVLGGQSANIGDRAKVEQDLRQIYTADYADQWRDYLKKSVVVSYSNIPDAAKKLAMTASPQSPLLAMFCLASQNVGADPEIAKSFKPLLAVVPSACTEQYVGQTNQEYMKSLLALQLSLGQISGSADPNDPAVTQAASQAAAAKVVTGGMAQGFGVDALGVTVRKLIEDPITHVEPLVKGLGAAALNKGGQSLCTEFRSLMTNKYPFNPQSPTDATLEEVNGIFKPGEGSLWKFWAQNLQKLLPKQGPTYLSSPAGGVTLTPGFVDFFNRAAAFSTALYSGSADPHLTYSLRPAPSEGIQSVTLNIDGQTIAYSGGTAAAKQFSWPAAQPGVKATAKFGGSTDITWATYPGLWSVFRFFGRAEKPVGAGASSSLEWVIRIGDQPATLPNGKPLTVRFDLDMGASPPVFQRGYFSNMRCVAEVAK
jgi:type VI secretion system protein ImpL